MKLILIIVGGTLLMAGLLIFLPPLANRPTGGKIEVSPMEYDAGDISMAAGVVKKDYEVKNIGSGPLKITGILTSCHCTTAVLKMGGKASPTFGMESGSLWSATLNPGEAGQLEVVFDPAYHGPSEIGPITRGIYISTNDPKNKRVELKLSANVAP